GVDRMGLGEKAGRTGEVTGAARVDAGKRDAGGVEGLGETTIVGTRGLKQHTPPCPPPGLDKRGDRRRRVRQPDRPSGTGLEDVKVMFSDIDSDHARSYVHRACSCAARSVAAASINCSGWVGKNTGGDRAG